MAAPSPGYSIIIRVDAPAGYRVTSEIAEAVGKAGAQVTALDVAESYHDRITVDVSANAANRDQLEDITEAVEKIEGAKVRGISDRTFLIHLGGKLEVTPRVTLRNRDDLSRAYTPGVARVCSAIAEDKALARTFTVKRNTVAVVTDGTAVLGLGDIGPEAAMPVMEGKAVLFKQFADVDAWPVALDTKDTEEIISICKAIAPAYGGINLEDIAAPRCFEIEARLREELDIPVFHDDQHGTAIVALAALTNALRVTGKKIDEVKVVISGVGAAGNAIIQLLMEAGVKHIRAAGRDGVLVRTQEETDDHRRWIAENTNEELFEGSLKEALAGADAFIGVSAPHILDKADIATMNDDAIVFALANPTPEIEPYEASEHAAVVATGRSDFPNQINNVLAFPGIFRGLLDVGASRITTEMLVAAADAISSCVTDAELNTSFIIPSIFHPEVTDRVAAAVAEVAKRNGDADKGEGDDSTPIPANI